ncbi:hypothetical protein V5N11_019866 [Cardamine amara subsp. amara]|uniref:BED-type domain-containing protein n=1 Tax=Cardamine amara subsp. amara TaxID=228776 RepID=A0ABD1AP93_CARAN
MEPPPRNTEELHTGNKRKRPASAFGSAKPPKTRKKYAKRAEAYNYFLQKDENCSKSICKYCAAEIYCDSKTVGTSPMICHIGRCKLYKDFDAKENQKVLSGDSDGNLKVTKYNPEMFSRSVNEMVVVNELAFSFVESEGWKRFCSKLLFWTTF